MSWSLTVLASPALLAISAQVEIEKDSGTETVFGIAESTEVVDEAVALIAEFADKVCRERVWLTTV